MREKIRHRLTAGVLALLLPASAGMGWSGIAGAQVRPVDVTMYPLVTPTALVLDQRASVERIRKTAWDPGDSNWMVFGDEAFREGFVPTFGRALQHGAADRLKGMTVAVEKFDLRETTNRKLGGYPPGYGLLTALVSAWFESTQETLVICSVSGNIDGKVFSVVEQTTGKPEYIEGTLSLCMVGLAEQLAAVSAGEGAKTGPGGRPLTSTPGDAAK